MTEIELPTLRSTDIVAVTVERAELAGSQVWVATIRQSATAPVCRRWYSDERPALAFAAEAADRHGLPLIDLRGPDDA